MSIIHTRVPDFAIERAKSRRGGRLHAFESINPRSTALLVVDMQNYFMQPTQAGEIDATREIISNVNQLAASMRASNGTIAWLRHTITEESEKRWPLWLNGLGSGEWSSRTREALLPGSQGHEIHQALDVEGGDLMIDKYCFSPFTEGSSDLHVRLRERGVDTLIITGVATNACCESTARDGMMMNYRVHFVSDATACRTKEEQSATLAIVTVMFGDVRTTDQILQLLKQD